MVMITGWGLHIIEKLPDFLCYLHFSMPYGKDVPWRSVCFFCMHHAHPTNSLHELNVSSSTVIAGETPHGDYICYFHHGPNMQCSNINTTVCSCLYDGTLGSQTRWDLGDCCGCQKCSYCKRAYHVHIASNLIHQEEICEEE